MNEQLNVCDLGEQGLLQRLQGYCPADLVGDDAALLSVAPGYSLVVTSDTLVDGVHFSDRTTHPADVGWRSVAANLSDLAAMGAAPLGITVSLGLPGEVTVAWVDQLYQGMIECLQQFDAPIVGGDICRSPVITIAITALGQVLPARTLRRSTAQPGDVILITGYHGASRAGLELLLNSETGQLLKDFERDRFIRAHQHPNPRLDVIPLLWEAVNSYKCSEAIQAPAPSPIQIAGMDSSDGLADAIVQLCQASSVGAIVDRSQVPMPPGLLHWVPKSQAIDWILYGGEDFELVLCLPLPIAQTLLSQLGEGAAIVGTITADQQVILQDSKGTDPTEILTLDRGYQHF